MENLVKLILGVFPFWLSTKLSEHNSKVKINIDQEHDDSNNKHCFVIHYQFSLFPLLLCLMAIAKAKIVTGQRPT